MNNKVKGMVVAKLPHRKINWIPYIFLFPILFMLGGIFIYPICVAIRLSFYNAQMASFSNAKYIGLQNYWNILHDPFFWSSLKLTLIYSVCTVIGSYVVGLFLAVMLNNRFKGRAFARAIIVLPWAIPDLAALLIWGWMFDPQYGILNYLLWSAGIVQQGFSWLSNTSMAMPSILIVTIWKWFPFSALILLAGLQSIPQDLYEAAYIDGANRIQCFFNITLPGLRAVSKILLLLLSVWSFGSFVIIYILTGGGPARATETLSIQVYMKAFRFGQVGEADALGMFLLLIALVFSIVYFKFILKEES